MTRRYDSFLVRCWSLDGVRHIKVEHVQTGAVGQAATLTAAMDWIAAQWSATQTQNHTLPRSADDDGGPSAILASEDNGHGRDGASAQTR